MIPPIEGWMGAGCLGMGSGRPPTESRESGSGSPPAHPQSTIEESTKSNPYTRRPGEGCGHELGIAAGSEADFWCDRRCKTSLADLDGPHGLLWPPYGRRSTMLGPFTRNAPDTGPALRFLNGGTTFAVQTQVRVEALRIPDSPMTDLFRLLD